MGTALTGRSVVHKLIEVHQSLNTLLDYASGRSVNSFLRRFPRTLSTYRGKRHPVPLSHSDYNNPYLKIQPSPKSIPRKPVITIPQNWYRFKPLLTVGLPP
jgi:hypothetical protein